MGFLFALVVAGIMVGTLYGLLGFSLTLMYRTTGVLSFAHAAFALVASYLYAAFECPVTKATSQCGQKPVMAPLPAAITVIVIVTVLALVVERLVIRPLDHTPTIVRSLATAGVLGVTAAAMLQIYGPVPRFVPPTRQLMPQGGFNIGSAIVDYQRTAIFIVSIILVGALALLLRATWFGLGIQAASQNRESARLVGVRPVATSRFNWALAGALSAVAGVLVAPILAVNIGTYAYLLVTAVGASLIARLASLPATFVAGIALGVVEALTPHFWRATGSGSVAIGGVVVAALYFNRSRLAQESRAALVDSAQRRRYGPVAGILARTVASLSDSARVLPRWVRFGGLAAVSLYLPLTDTYYAAVGLNITFNALLALSLFVVLGVAGRPSLLQMGLAGVAAYTVATCVGEGMDYVVAAALGLAAATFVGSVLGCLALRFQGVQYAIATLTFGAAISAFLLEMPFLKNSLSTPTTFGMDLLQSKNAFRLAVVLAAVAFLVARNFSRSSLGRSVAAGSERELLLEHFGLNPFGPELAAVALSSFIAGAAGVTYTLAISQFTTFQFSPVTSITILLATLVGGVSSLWGPVITGVVLGYGPTLFQFIHSRDANAIPQLVMSLAALVVIIKLPGGVSSLGSWASNVLEHLPPAPEPHRLRGVDLSSLAVDGHAAIDPTDDPEKDGAVLTGAETKG
jgi:branched-chain amino acid transport system permease protein